MSRATTSGPVSESRVATGCLVSSARISLIGRRRSIGTTSPVRSSVVVSGRYCAGSVSSCSRYTPSAVILASAWRSAEQETAIATGQDAPCRGSRITRTSWQKYLPPNCAPIPARRVISSTWCSSSGSRNPWAADHDRQVVGRAGGRAQGPDLLLQEREHGGGVEHGLGLLVQERLVGRAA